MHFSWTGPLTVNGDEIAITDYPRMDNPWAHVEFQDRNLSVQDSANGTALLQNLARGIRIPFRVVD